MQQLLPGAKRSVRVCPIRILIGNRQLARVFVGCRKRTGVKGGEGIMEDLHLDGLGEGLWHGLDIECPQVKRRSVRFAMDAPKEQGKADASCLLGRYIASCTDKSVSLKGNSQTLKGSSLTLAPKEQNSCVNDFGSFLQRSVPKSRSSVEAKPAHTKSDTSTNFLHFQPGRDSPASSQAKTRLNAKSEPVKCLSSHKRSNSFCLDSSTTCLSCIPENASHTAPVRPEFTDREVYCHQIAQKLDAGGSVWL
mmetsp:Transcript_19195/g.52989  ORF Transcript_19195/g.52989 Transcript_19195/m.52989 type:complete len:250 (+) Transcript_19195:209-958(+)